MKRNKLCSVDGCDRPLRAKGLCSTHWQRQAGYIKKSMGEDICAKPGLKWLEENALTCGSDLCLTWPFHVGTHGYGEMHFEGRTQSAARVCCTLSHGSAPDGMEVLHSCHDRKCVNPRHLRWGTRADNVKECIEAGRFSYPPGRHL